MCINIGGFGKFGEFGKGESSHYSVTRKGWYDWKIIMLLMDCMMLLWQWHQVWQWANFLIINVANESILEFKMLVLVIFVDD